MRIHQSGAAVALVLATIAAASPAAAISNFYQTEANSAYAVSNVSDFAFAAVDFSLPGVSISVSQSPVPTVRASAVADCCGSTSAIGQFGYLFEINGPERVSVPLLAHIVASGGVSAANVEGNALAAASINILAPFDTLGDRVNISNEASINSGFSDPLSFAVDEWVSFNEYAQDPIDVAGSAGVRAAAAEFFLDGEHLTVGQASGHVYLDPFFEIDPVWSAANPGYSLAFPDGFGNLPGGVPEPASWALMVAGFGGLGAALRRRRAPKALAAA
jgi:hypothetical protein